MAAVAVLSLAGCSDGIPSSRDACIAWASEPTTTAGVQLRMSVCNKRYPQSVSYTPPTPPSPPPSSSASTADDKHAGLHPLTKKWLQENPWFDAPRYAVQSAEARAIDANLKARGIDATTPAFYVELNRQLRRRYPKLPQSPPRSDDWVPVNPLTGQILTGQAGK